MELKVNDVFLPESIEFNYEELKTELSERVKMYTGLVYTDDQIKEAKADRAKLNKLKTALKDERIRRKKQYMKPFDEFEKKINEIIAIIDEPIGLIDSQVKDYELKKQEEKQEQIKNFFDRLGKPDFLDLSMIMKREWLNASYSMIKIKNEMVESIERISLDLVTIQNLPKFSFEAEEAYKRTLDLNYAINEANRLDDLQKMKEEHLRKLQEEKQKNLEQPETMQKDEVIETPESSVPEVQTPEEPKNVPVYSWVSFEALLCKDTANLLKNFCASNGIKIRPPRMDA